jgi:hypothetical protein
VSYLSTISREHTEHSLCNEFSFFAWTSIKKFLTTDCFKSFMFMLFVEFEQQSIVDKLAESDILKS